MPQKVVVVQIYATSAEMQPTIQCEGN